MNYPSLTSLRTLPKRGDSLTRRAAIESLRLKLFSGRAIGIEIWCGRYQMAAVLPQVEDRAVLTTNFNSAQTCTHYFEQPGLGAGYAQALRTPAEIELGRLDLAGQAVMRPDRVAALVLIGFLRRWVVTRESEQIESSRLDLIPQIGSLTDVEDLVCLRGHISPWLFRYDVTPAGSGGRFTDCARRCSGSDQFCEALLSPLRG